MRPTPVNHKWSFSQSVRNNDRNRGYQTNLVGCYEDIQNSNSSLEIRSTLNLSDINNKAWSTALIPLKTMGMTFFMIYMSGNNAGIFGILIIGYALTNSIKILFSVQQHFLPLQNITNKSFLFQRILYILYSLGGILFILYRLINMGLIPVNRGDFINNLPSHDFPLRIGF
ncbi:uncharacterized protein CMU_027140 [Cryptosporidium muris RN66]|uniref:ER membrane protein complex subunit 4 n=1 Tax=Cryptosporidium muris (strain RN66) TaxID=441375 RepID=B6ABF3_CRYMR|nr:uncharacterized protein CMU_027140 [Cryptosporidium muris RN66]EEA05705.1 hypothetical protein, conserved [Cryptosporidium muris RN66]|eukprot:XP_002140054.1 hypothetical protein [Cryptosporidium muris RN66]